MGEEYKSYHVRTGRPVLVGQSDPLFVPKSSLMKTSTLSTDDPAQEDLLQKYQERVERLSQQDRLIKFCTDDAGTWWRCPALEVSSPSTFPCQAMEEHSRGVQPTPHDFDAEYRRIMDLFAGVAEWLLGGVGCQAAKFALAGRESVGPTNGLV